MGMLRANQSRLNAWCGQITTQCAQAKQNFRQLSVQDNRQRIALDYSRRAVSGTNAIALALVRIYRKAIHYFILLVLI
jgi:hypothetical protein